ncbi:MAG TPA: protein kinase [Thermoanaerobaculia bacterium]|nr:protein kinase [Thermoanaerobaculia bacterium]
MADRKDRLSGMTSTPSEAQNKPTEKLDPKTISRPARRQVLLYAPPPAIAGPYLSILESEGLDVLVANSPESANVLLENGAPELIFAVVPLLGEQLREEFRKRAPRAEIRAFRGLAPLLEEAIIPPREAFDFAVRAILSTAGVLSSARGTPRERSARILQWSEKAAAALGFVAADTAAVRIAAALFDVPAALSGSDKRDRDVHRSLLSEFVSGIGAPFSIDAASSPDRPPTPFDIVEAAAEYALLLEDKARSPIVSLRRMAGAGEIHPAAAEAIIAAAGGGVAAASRRGRVLVVDGDAASRNVLALRLANEGYETDTAADGRAALESIRRNPPSLIISETVLPGLDGFGLLDALKREGHARVPFIFISSRADALSMNKGLLLGAADFLAKPVNVEVLLTKLQKVLGESIQMTDVASRLTLSDVSVVGTESYPSVTYDQLAPGVSILGRFRLLADLGEGGMGKVFKARDDRLEEDVVVKVMKDSLTGDRKMLEHFKREIRLARKISHPNVVRIFDFWEAGPLKFVTMEFLQGTDLAREIRSRGAFPVPVAVRLATEFFDGLAAAHDLGVVHRDIKPDNVFVLGGGRLKILDFGIAQGLDPVSPDVGTQTQSIIGTPAYMSPEQLLGQKLDPRTDIYSAGIMLYQLLTGELPFISNDRAEAVTMRLHREADRPSQKNPKVPPELDQFVMKLLARSRDQRMADAHAAADELRAMRSLT